MVLRDARIAHNNAHEFLSFSFQVKVKGKPSNDRPPYFDFSVLRLKSLRMILLSSGIGSIGAYTPLFYLVNFFWLISKKKKGSH